MAGIQSATAQIRRGKKERRRKKKKPQDENIIYSTLFVAIRTTAAKQ